jgi:hypothetical protein
MKTHTDQQLAANYMGAVAHLLGGRPGRFAEFIDKVELILSGQEPHAAGLMRFRDAVRDTGRPVIWMHVSADAPNVPLIGLVAQAGHQCLVVEHCCLWSTPNGKLTRLVPDSFKMGAFQFDRHLNLIHQPKPPTLDYADATNGMIRAYSCLRRLEAEQLARGDRFELPELATAA